MANTPPKDKRFESGEIVFWCHQCGHKYSVHYGMVDEQYKFDVYIDYLTPRERRRIYSDYVKQAAEMANDRNKYKSLMPYLKKITKCDGGKAVADDIAATWRREYKRRTAMMDELRKAGF